jgi:extracellular factor (EF) 3-hydroxypalmitic acid methyl ester biosynthesis protein
MEKVFTDRPYDMRRHARMPSAEPVHYLVSMVEAKNRTWLSCKGQLLDTSETGICIQTNHPLSPGHIVWFDGSTEEKAGFVRWCRQLDSIYKIGIELDKISVRKLDEATNAFLNALKQIEDRCSDHTEDPDEILLDIRKAVDIMCTACETFEREIRDREMIRDAQIRFREKTDSILSKSYCINRARTWPQGYQGDYKTLEGIYRNTPLSDGIGYYLDLWGLNIPLAVAVRNRIQKLEMLLRDELRQRRAPAVMNIACGSCREVFELAADIERSGARFTCIDLDNDALAFSANRLSFTPVSPVTSDQVVMRKYNAVRMFDHDLNLHEFGMQDIIYSVGLFDYLPTDFLINLFRSLHALLNPGGKLIASFKNASRYRYQEYHWIFDWDGFLQRTEQDFRNILSDAGIPDSAIYETREETGVIVFYVVTK